MAGSNAQHHIARGPFAQALLAAEAWREACGVELVRVHRGDGEYHLTEDRGIPWCDDDLHSGCTRGSKIEFAAGAYAIPIIAHEFGHALGLEHADGGIMQLGDLYEDVDEAGLLKSGVITAGNCERAD